MILFKPFLLLALFYSIGKANPGEIVVYQRTGCNGDSFTIAFTPGTCIDLTELNINQTQESWLVTCSDFDGVFSVTDYANPDCSGEPAHHDKAIIEGALFSCVYAPGPNVFNSLQVAVCTGQTDPDKKEEYEYLQASFMFFVLGVAIFVVHFMEKYRCHVIPESGAIMIIGGFFGFLGWAAGNSAIGQLSAFDVDLFQLILLPAIIFESGYSLRKTGMFQNIRAILLYAVVGTTICAIIVAGTVYLILTPSGVGGLTAIESLLFGSLISATDTVATLAIMQGIFRMDTQAYSDDAPLLYNLIFGESVLNDAVAIVLFNTFQGFHHHATLDGAVVVEIIFQFLLVAAGSVVIGVAFGVLSAFIMKWSVIRENPKFDIIVLYLCAYGSYCIAAGAGLSGLFAIFFCGVFMGHYTWYNLSVYSQLSSGIILKAISNIAEMFIFCFLGMSLFGSTQLRGAWRADFLFAVLFTCLIARAIQVVPLTYLANIGRRRKITWKEMVIIWYSGLRGALAFALSLKTIWLGTPNATLIITTTLTIAIITTLFQGSTTRFLIKSLKIDSLDWVAPTEEEEEAIEAERKKSRFGLWDAKWFQPLFLLNTDIAGGAAKRKSHELVTELSRVQYTTKVNEERQTLYDGLIDVLQYYSVKYEDTDPQVRKLHKEREAAKLFWIDTKKWFRGLAGLLGQKLEQAQDWKDSLDPLSSAAKHELEHLDEYFRNIYKLVVPMKTVDPDIVANIEMFLYRIEEAYIDIGKYRKAQKNFAYWKKKSRSGPLRMSTQGELLVAAEYEPFYNETKQKYKDKRARLIDVMKALEAEKEHVHYSTLENARKLLKRVKPKWKKWEVPTEQESDVEENGFPEDEHEDSIGRDRGDDQDDQKPYEKRSYHRDRPILEESITEQQYQQQQQQQQLFDLETPIKKSFNDSYDDQYDERDDNRRNEDEKEKKLNKKHDRA